MPEEKTALPEPKIQPQPKAKTPVTPEKEKQAEPDKTAKPEVKPKMGPVVAEKPEPQAQPAEKKTEIAKPDDQQEPSKTSEKMARPTGPGYDNKKINEVLDISELIDTELQKPLEKQDYEPYLKQLRKIAHDAKAEKAQLYAQFQINRIERYQLAKKATQQLEQQEKTLEQRKQEIIKKRRAATVPKQKEQGKYIAKGVIKPSYIYTKATGQKRYIILQPSGQIACYAIPTYNLNKSQIEKHIGKKVGLKGTAIHDRYSPTSLVEFSGIVPLE
jgi:type II secretory pathway pseudopilin PulG